MDDSLNISKRDFLRFRNKLEDCLDGGEEPINFELDCGNIADVIEYAVALSRAKTLNDIINAIDNVFKF